MNKVELLRCSECGTRFFDINDGFDAVCHSCVARNEQEASRKSFALVSPWVARNGRHEQHVHEIDSRW